MTITCECDKCGKQCTPSEMYELKTNQLVRETSADLHFDICFKCRTDLVDWIESDGTQASTS